MTQFVRTVVLLLAVASVAESRPPVSPAASEPTPIGIFVTNDDYPPEAVKLRQEGTARYRATISPQGRVTDCTIVASSGSAILDAQTCDLMRRRGHFTPAADAHGQPVEAVIVKKMRWVLPAGPVAIPQPYRSFTIKMEGDQPHCSVDWDGKIRMLKTRACKTTVDHIRAAGRPLTGSFKADFDPGDLEPE